MPRSDRSSRLVFPSALVPSPLTALVGRARELDELHRLLQAARLVTLTGAGGSGKTRLAIEIASRAREGFRDGVAWVDFSGLTDPAMVPDHVATALGVAEDTSRPAGLALLEGLAGKHVLLAFDNCEHVIDVCAPLAAALLGGCPALTIIATSREALGVAGERTWLVPLLSVPACDARTRDEVAKAEAAQLFIARAEAADPAFVPSDANAPAVAEICRRLDGIPLAIELAAARVKVLTPDQIAARLDSAFSLLTGGTRVAVARHRTLRETIDWSHRLLTPSERILFRRLSVFAGGFSLGDLEEVCTDAALPRDAALTVLAGLVEKSLAHREVDAADARFRLLETMRQYAAERLSEAGETDRFRMRHAERFLALAEAAEPYLLGGANDLTWIAKIEDEHHNIRAAAEWCQEDAARVEIALRLDAALHWFGFARGRFREGRQRLEAALACAPASVPPLILGRAYIALGWFAVWQADFAAVRAPMARGVATLGEAGDRRALAYALMGLGTAAFMEGQPAEAAEHFDAALACAESDGDTVVVAITCYWRGLVALETGDATGARASFERALRVGRALGHRPAIAHPLYVLGRLEQHEGHAAAARLNFTESVRIHHEVEDRWGMFQTLAALGEMAAADGDLDRAARLLGASESVRMGIGVRLRPRDEDAHQRVIASVRERLGHRAFQDAAADGGSMSLDRMVEYALAAAARPAAPAVVPARRAALGVRALGPFEAVRGSKRISRTAWGSAKARELLVFLLCHPGGCTKDQVGLALWPDGSPAQVRNNFHVTLHRVRKALAPGEWIAADGDRYRIDPAHACEFDADIFERETRAALDALRTGRGDPAPLQAALAWYRGDLLSGERAGEWHTARRESLQRLHADALIACADALVAAGRVDEAATRYRQLVTIDPVHEAAYRGLMKCAAHLGDRTHALRMYDRLTRLLRDELDADPEPETIQIYESLLGS